MNRRRGLIQIHIVAVLAAATGLFGKYLPVSPVIIIAGRTVFGCLSLLLMARLTGASLRPRTRHWWPGLAVSGVVLAVHWFSFFRAIQVSTVAIGVLAFSSFPLFVTFLEPLFFRERLRAADVAVAIVVLLGLAVLTPAFDLTNSVTQGVAWGVLSGFSYALLSLLSRSHIRAYAAVAVAFYQQLFAALCTLPIVLYMHATVSGHQLWLLGLLGVVFTGLTQMLFVESLHHIRAQLVSVVMSLEPVYAILLALLLLGEVPPLRTLLGGLIIGMAVLVAMRGHAGAAGPEVTGAPRVTGA